LHSIPFQQLHVPVGDHSINTIVVDPENGNEELPPLVLLHGFGGGAGFWLRNLRELADKQRVIAIDMVGFGRSGRPPFEPQGAEATEQWLVDSLEKWRQVRFSFVRFFFFIQA
jgi:pimeloyl-ACP methyl ester carboxylesterase